MNLVLSTCFNGNYKKYTTITGAIGALERLIRASTIQWFHVIPVWLYAIIGDVLAFYHDHISLRLIKSRMAELRVISNENDSDLINGEVLSDFLQCLNDLLEAAEMTTHKFAPMLLANLFSSLLFALTFIFRAILDVRKQEIIASIWDLSDVVDAVIRFWLVAYTADRLRLIVIALLDYL